MDKLKAKSTKAEDEEKPVTEPDDDEAKKKAKAEDDTEDEQAEGEDDEHMEDDEDEESMADPAVVAEMCVAAGQPTMAASMIRAKLSVKGVRTRLKSAADVKGLVALARKMNPTIGLGLAAEYAKNGASLTEVRADLFDRICAGQSPEIRNSHQPDAMQAGGDHGWGKVIAKTLGPKG
jgi:hypothetical protein